MTDDILLPADEPPKSGEWVDVHDILANPTDEELAAGLADGLEVFEEADVPKWTDRLLHASATSASVDFANRLAQHIRSYAGVQVSVELVVGRPSSLTASDWLCDQFRTNFGHHTVSRWSSSNLTPVLKLCKTGRSDVPGPLCNGYGGYDLTYRIICVGLANHPGAGGPFRLSRGGFVIPKDSARPYAWGTEWEGGLSEGDWTRTLRNPRTGQTMTMYEFMGRVDAAINTFKGWPKGEFWVADQLEHKTWTTRKRDRDYKSREWFQNNARKYTKTTPAPPPPPPPIPLPEEDDMSQLFIDTEEWTPFLIVPKDGKSALLHLGLSNKAAGPVDIHVVYAGAPEPNLFSGQPKYIGGRDFKGWNPDINGRFSVPAGVEIVSIKVVGLKGRKLAVSLTR